MKNSWSIIASLLILTLMPALCNSGALFSEWDMSPNDLVKKKTPELRDKSLWCGESMCQIEADYTAIGQKMKATYAFAGNKSSGRLEDVTIRSSEEAINHLGLELDLSNFKQYFFGKYGEGNRSVQLGMVTYIWRDVKRNNVIELYTMYDRVYVKYTPISSGNDDGL